MKKASVGQCNVVRKRRIKLTWISWFPMLVTFIATSPYSSNGFTTIFLTTGLAFLLSEVLHLENSNRPFLKLCQTLLFPFLN